MDTTAIEQAFRRLGQVASYPTDVEMLLVGGAAGMLSGLFRYGRTTTDCDVMIYAPQGAMIAVESAADQIAAELNLPKGWLNSNVQMRSDALPEGWRSRRVWVGSFGRLQVWAASRPDLIAMKVLAGRPRDLEDLEDMKVQRDDLRFVRSYIGTLGRKGTPQDQIDAALGLLEILKVHDHE